MVPDTLPEKWTWECLPEWERSVLQGIIIELSGLKWELAPPSLDKDKWFGLKVWKSGWFGNNVVGSMMMVGMIYCLKNVLLVAVGNEVERFDLFEPTSIDKAVNLIHGVMGC